MDREGAIRHSGRLQATGRAAHVSQWLVPDLPSFVNAEADRRGSYLWLLGALSLYAAVFLIYSVTWAFTWDEGYHLLAAQLMDAGKRPYIDFCFPQTPLNAYWNAGWMRLLGQNWRVPHAFAALFTIGAVLLTADFVFRRFPVGSWRLAAAIAAGLATGLNAMVFELRASGAGLRHLPVRPGRGVPDYRTRGGSKWTAPRRPGRFLRRRGRRFVALVGCRRPGVARLDAVLQSRGPPMDEAPGVRRGNGGSLCARVLAVLARAAADLVQRVSISRLLSQAVLARDDPPRPGNSDILDRLRPGPGARPAGGVRPAVCRAPKRLAARVAGGVLPVRVARGGAFRSGWPRPSHLRAIFSADRAVSGDSSCGGAVRYRLPRARRGPRAVAGAAGLGAVRTGIGQIAI